MASKKEKNSVETNDSKIENIEKLKAQLTRDKAFAEIYKYFLEGNFQLDLNKFSQNRFRL